MLECVLPLILNLSPFPLNVDDMSVFWSATRTCEKRYKKCLTEFRKTDILDYKAICGEVSGKKTEIKKATKKIEL